MLAGALQARSATDHEAWLRFRQALRRALSEGRLHASHGEGHWRTVETCAARMIPERVLTSIAPAEILLLVSACVAHDCFLPDQPGRRWLVDDPAQWGLDPAFAANLRRVSEIALDISRIARAPRWTYLGGQAVDLHRVISVLHVADRLDPEHTDCPAPADAEIEPEDIARWPNVYGVSIGLIDPREGIMRIDLTSTDRAQRRAAEAAMRPWCEEALQAVRNTLLACGMPFRKVEAHDLHARPSADMLAAQELMRTRAGTRRRPATPFKALEAYGEQDGHLLPARDEDTIRLSGRCLVSPLTVLTGESGVGKTSLAAAGLIPWLRLNDYEGVYARCLNDPIGSLLASARTLLPAGRTAASLPEAASILAETYNRPVILVLDQAQELFTRLGSRTRLDFAQQIAELLSMPSEPAHLLIAIQRDFFHHLIELQSVLPTILAEVITVPRLNRDQAEQVIHRSLGRFRLRFDHLVISHILDDLMTVEGILPVELQIVCDLLTNAVEEDETRVGFEVYRRIGPARRMLAGVLDARLRPFRFRRLTLARAILLNCVTAQGTKAILTAEECAVDTGADLATVRDVLAGLEEQKLLHRLTMNGKDAWELSHAYVAHWLEPSLRAAETEAKGIDDLLHRELNNYERFGELLDRDKLALIHDVRRRLTLTPEELDLLIRSSAATNYHPDYWLPRANELAVSQQMVLCIDLLYSPQPDLRDALRSMISRLDHKAILPTLLGSLQEADPAVRETALALLREVDQQIVRALERGDATQQQQAAYALGQIGARHAVAPLVEQVQAAASAEVREQAAEALAEIDRPRSAELLLRSLRTGTEVSRWNAAMALSRLGRDAAVRDRLRREAERADANDVLVFAYARACIEGQQFADAERLLQNLEKRQLPEAQKHRLATAWADLARWREDEQRGALSWPMYRGSAAGRAYTSVGLTLPLDLKWTFATSDRVYSSPAVAGSMVFIGSDDHKLYALDADSGLEIWTYQAPAAIRSSPCVLGELVIVPDAQGTLYALDAETGAQAWTRKLGHAVGASVRGHDDLAVIGTMGGQVVAFDPRTGEPKWTRALEGPVESSAALTSELVAIGGPNQGLWMLRASDGEVLWRYRTVGELRGSPAFTRHGVLVGDSEGRLDYLDRDGEVLWSNFLRGPVGCSAAVAHGLIYLGSADGEIAAFAHDTGRRVWTFETQGEFSASPAVAGQVVFIGSLAGDLFALDAQSGKQLWRYPTGYSIHSSPAVADRRLFVALRYYNMCAFAELSSDAEV